MIRWLFQYFVAGKSPQPSSLRSFQGEAVVQKVIRQGAIWRVQYRGSFWTARCTQTVILEKDDWVDVVGCQGIDLVIKPVSTGCRSIGSSRVGATGSETREAQMQSA